MTTAKTKGKSSLIKQCFALTQCPSSHFLEHIVISRGRRAWWVTRLTVRISFCWYRAVIDFSGGRVCHREALLAHVGVRENLGMRAGVHKKAFVCSSPSGAGFNCGFCAHLHRRAPIDNYWACSSSWGCLVDRVGGGCLTWRFKRCWCLAIGVGLKIKK